jgi:hypothetical protein
MSVQQRSCMQAVLPDIRENRGYGHMPLGAWVARGALAAASFAAVSFIETPNASAVPAYARQTGQPCATCHTAFPELTPYGRQFKLMGYTQGGTRCNDGSAKSDETQVPLAVMAWPATFTGVKNSANQSAMGAPGASNDMWLPSQFSVFIAGQLYCDVGAFAQITYDRTPASAFAWDNTDIRYAKTGVIEGTSIVYGITANNNPGVQDVWNTGPAWNFPYIGTEVGPGQSFNTMLGGGGQWGGAVGGAGGYVWINSSFYAEFTAYGNLSPRLLTDLAGGFDGTLNRFSGMAPYWRFAYEKTWDKNSLMFGTYGMYAEQKTGVDATVAADSTGTVSLFSPNKTDPTLDIGVDTQYQWIGEENIVTVRGAYVWQRKKNSAEYAAMNGAIDPTTLAPYTLPNASDTLNDLNVSATYIYDRKYSFTAGYLRTWGTTDVGLYSTAIGGSANGSPNTAAWNFDLAYLPFMNGGPALWPWFNARIGIQYTHYDKFDGTWTNVDGSGLKAGGNDTVFLYTWLMF